MLRVVGAMACSCGGIVLAAWLTFWVLSRAFQREDDYPP